LSPFENARELGLELNQSLVDPVIERIGAV
jgi:hypothetical protein